MRNRLTLVASGLLAGLALLMFLPLRSPAQDESTPASTEEKATAEQAGKGATAPDSTRTWDYVGVKTCAMCHKGPSKGNVYEVWLASGHAKAFEKLGEANQKNPTCLACHTTGYGKALAPGVTPVMMENVQCEACHGPGSGYKAMSVMKNRPEALKKGLVIPAEEGCDGCHAGKFPEGHPKVEFNYESALAKIAHHMTPVEPEKK